MGSFDAHPNFARSLVAVAPSPATSGTSLTVNPLDGRKFSAFPFNATVTDGVNNEIVRVTGVTTDTLTIVRGQEGTTAISIIPGMSIFGSITQKTLTDVENFAAYPPQVWPGFGLNYQRPQQYWASDAAYFKAIGITNIRPSLATLFLPWGQYDQSGSGQWRTCAAYFANLGFYVTWGIAGVAGGTLSQQLASLVSEATFLVENGIVLGDFNIGNEMELFSLAPYGGTIASLNAYIRGTMAPAIKAIPGWNMPVSYSMSQNTTAFNDWVANGLGGLDKLSFHPYGSINVAQQTVSMGNFPLVATGVETFGDRFYVSEFNLDPIGLIPQLDPYIGATYMTQIVQNYLTVFTKTQFTASQMLSMFQFFTFDDSTGYQALNSDNTFIPVWDTFFQSGNHLTGVPGVGQYPTGT